MKPQNATQPHTHGVADVPSKGDLLPSLAGTQPDGTVEDDGFVTVHYFPPLKPMDEK